MKHAAIILVTLTLMPLASFSQIYISGGINYGNYRMASMKQLSAEFKQQLDPIPVEEVDNFPAYIGFDVQVLSNVQKVKIGGSIGLNSTGSRMYYEDYSGKIQLDQRLIAINLDGALEYAFDKVETKKSEFYTGVRAGLGLSNYKLEQYYRIGTNGDLNQIVFNSTNVHITPALGLRRYIGKLFIQGEIRYQFDIPGDVTLADDADAKLTNEKGDNVKIDWSGFRVALQIGIVPNKK